MVESLSDTGAIGGKLSYEKPICGRPSFKEAVDRGLKFWTAHWQAPYIWPMLADFLQDALNIVAKLSVSQVEIALEIQQLASADAKSGNEVDWKQIHDIVAKSNPTCLGWIGSLITVVKGHWGRL